MVGVGAFARRHQLDDLAMGVLGARVRAVDLLGLAPAVVGQRHIHPAVDRIWLDVLGPVHGRRTDQIGRLAREDQDFSLAREAVLGGQRALALDQRQPGALVVVEFGDIERAVVEQGAIRGAGGLIVSAVRDVLVQVIEALVVAGIDDQAAVLVDDRGGALVLEAAERGALDRDGSRIIGVVLDHPAEAVRLVRLLRHVEALDRLVPGVPPVRNAVALVGLSERPRLGSGAAEIAVEVLLGHQHGAPGCLAAGAVVDRAQHLGPGGVGAGLEQLVAGGRAGERHLGLGRDAACVLAVLDHPPAPVLLDDLDHRAAVRHHFDRALLGRLRSEAGLADGIGVGALLGPAREHELRAGVLMVDMKQAMLGAVRAPRQREVAHEVVVVAELPGLGVGSLVHRVEGGRAGQHRIAPADQDLRRVTRGDLHVVSDGVRNALEAEAGASCQRYSAGQRAAECAHHRGGDEALERGPPAHAPPGELEQRLVAGAVGAKVVPIADDDWRIFLIQAFHVVLPPQDELAAPCRACAHRLYDPQMVER